MEMFITFDDVGQMMSSIY